MIHHPQIILLPIDAYWGLIVFMFGVALQNIAEKYTDDTDAIPLAGEALFDLQPWDAWDPLTKASPSPQ